MCRLQSCSSPSSHPASSWTHFSLQSSFSSYREIQASASRKREEKEFHFSSCTLAWNLYHDFFVFCSSSQLLITGCVILLLWHQQKNTIIVFKLCVWSPWTSDHHLFWSSSSLTTNKICFIHSCITSQHLKRELFSAHLFYSIHMRSHHIFSWLNQTKYYSSDHLTIESVNPETETERNFWSHIRSFDHPSPHLIISSHQLQVSFWEEKERKSESFTVHQLNWRLAADS